MEEGPNRTLELLIELTKVELITHWGGTDEQLQFQGGKKQVERRSLQAATIESSSIEEVVNKMLTSFVKSWQGATVEDQKERTWK